MFGRHDYQPVEKWTHYQYAMVTLTRWGKFNKEKQLEYSAIFSIKLLASSFASLAKEPDMFLGQKEGLSLWLLSADHFWAMEPAQRAIYAFFHARRQFHPTCTTTDWLMPWPDDKSPSKTGWQTGDLSPIQHLRAVLHAAAVVLLSPWLTRTWAMQQLCRP